MRRSAGRRSTCRGCVHVRPALGHLTTGGQRCLGLLLRPVVVVAWVVLIELGWTLIYWPQLADGSHISEGLQQTVRGGFLDALYLPMITVATLGFDDIVPTEEWLRIAVPVQALLDFVLLTAAVTWQFLRIDGSPKAVLAAYAADHGHAAAPTG
jgi:Ion channel